MTDEPEDAPDDDPEELLDELEDPGMYDDITRELQRLFPPDRMQRIVDHFGLEGTEEDYEFLGDLISAIFTRGIEFGAVEVAAQQIEAGADVQPQIEIAHVDLP
jgi:hexokinase